MSEKYFIIHLRSYLDKNEPTYIGEEPLYDLLSDFSCPQNPDIEYFLLHNAIEFTKKDQSITYLVFDASDSALVGYFSLALKPLSVHSTDISKTTAKKSHVSVFMMKNSNLHHCCISDCSIRKKLCPAKRKANPRISSPEICFRDHF